MAKPIAVILSDVHYSLPTLELADAATRQACRIANDLKVPLIVAGDLHDSKANLRGECVNRMLETFQLCKTPVYILRGNHDALNERSEEHSLNFLKPYASVVTHPVAVRGIGYLLPYYHDVEALRAVLREVPYSSRLIMHQGLTTANMGEYVQDASALDKGDVKDFRVISGHYHARQDVKTGRARTGAVGLWSYVGNPYTLSFGEADDPEKGFQILMDDGTLEFVPTGLRKHVKVDIQASDGSLELLAPEKLRTQKEADLLRIRLTGPSSAIRKFSKDDVATFFSIVGDFRLDLNVTDVPTQPGPTATTESDVLDAVLESTTGSDAERLKRAWRALCE